MPLTLWTEQGPGARSAAFFKRIASSLTHPDRPARYIVPNADMKRRAEELCLSDDAILFGSRILTHRDWCAQLASDARPVISETRRRHIVMDLLIRLPMTYFHPGAQNAGLADVLIRGITSALRAGLSSDALTRLAKEFGQEREQDLALLFAAYRDQLATTGLRDPDDFSGASAHVADHRLIFDMGTAPMPILWQLIRGLEQQTDCDLHVIVPEFLRFTAERRLATEARAISADEWVPRERAPQTLKQAANPSAAYQWAAAHLPDGRVAVITADANPLLWWDCCRDHHLLPDTPLPLPLSASPVSAPWNDSRIWAAAPESADMDHWQRWWQRQLYPETRLANLRQRLKSDRMAARALAAVSQWESIWQQCRSLNDATTQCTPQELRNMIDPLLQTPASISNQDLPFVPATLHGFLGDPLDAVMILDATQSGFPAIASSPFFRRAALFPEDPNAQQLLDAFPTTDQLLAQSLAAWERLGGLTRQVMGVFSAVTDTGSEQLPSLLFECDVQHVITETSAATALPVAAPQETLLQAPDTTAHVRARYADHLFSITELEMFADCSFRHFAKYILNIDVPDDDTPELLAKEEGNLIHQLLERYYKSGIPLQDSLKTLLPHPTALKRLQAEHLIAVASSAIAFDSRESERLQDAALTPSHFEWTFGRDTAPLPLQDSTGQQIKVQGKIDRIDIHSKTGRMLVMDYKFRETKSLIAEIKQGRHLQLPIYVMAAQAAFPNYHILGALLFDLKLTQRCYGIAQHAESEFLGISKRLKTLLKEDDWDALLQTAADHAVRYAQTIASAQIPVTPHDCEYCDWKGLI